MMSTEEACRHPRHANIASAVYGTILVTAVVAVVSADGDVGITDGIVVILTTTLVFWLAHVYANLLALRVTLKRRPSRADIGRLMGEEWPLVQAGALPILALLLGAAGLYSRDVAFAVAMWSGVAALFFWGVIYARREGSGITGMLLSGGFNTVLGLVIVFLKALVSH